MRNKYFIVIIFTIALFSECSCPLKNKYNFLVSLQEIDTCKIKSSFRKEINNYLNENKFCDVFILRSTMLCEKTSNRDKINEIFSIYPATFSYLSSKSEWSITRSLTACYFVLNDKIILFQTPLDGLYDQHKLYEAYDKLNKIIDDRTFNKAKKKYFIVYINNNRTRTISEKYFWTSDKFEPIMPKHKTLDTTFVAPSIN